LKTLLKRFIQYHWIRQLGLLAIGACTLLAARGADFDWWAGRIIPSYVVAATILYVWCAINFTARNSTWLLKLPLSRMRFLFWAAMGEIIATITWVGSTILIVVAYELLKKPVPKTPNPDYVYHEELWRDPLIPLGAYLLFSIFALIFIFIGPSKIAFRPLKKSESLSLCGSAFLALLCWYFGATVFWTLVAGGVGFTFILGQLMCESFGLRRDLWPRGYLALLGAHFLAVLTVSALDGYYLLHGGIEERLFACRDFRHVLPKMKPDGWELLLIPQFRPEVAERSDLFVKATGTKLENTVSKGNLNQIFKAYESYYHKKKFACVSPDFLDSWRIWAHPDFIREYSAHRSRCNASFGSTSFHGLFRLKLSNDEIFRLTNSKDVFDQDFLVSYAKAHPGEVKSELLVKLIVSNEWPIEVRKNAVEALNFQSSTPTSLENYLRAPASVTVPSPFLADCSGTSGKSIHEDLKHADEKKQDQRPIERRMVYCALKEINNFDTETGLSLFQARLVRIGASRIYPSWKREDILVEREICKANPASMFCFSKEAE